MLTVRGLTPFQFARLGAAGWLAGRKPVRALLCIADHFEPQWQKPAASVARERVQRWRSNYPLMAARYSDSRGRAPQHTFFFPAEDYQPEHIDSLATICRHGYGDVEVHLHHDNDTSESLRETLSRVAQTLHQQHGLLRREADERVSYGFIHGNWALDNSRTDGRWCGVNNELTILRQTGCYADFTMPSAPAPCQTSTVNSIYYATDDPNRPKSHDRGQAARAGARPPADSLLMIQGPLMLDWRHRKCGILPRIENGDLTAVRPPTIQRLRTWLAANIHVGGSSPWRFIKLHTHGAQEANANMLLGEPMRQFHAALAELAAASDWFHYYYVTAHEMAQAVHVLESRPAAAPEEVLSVTGQPASAGCGLPESAPR